MVNIRLLRGKMAIAGKTQKDIATLLNKTEASISAKFKGKSPLYIDEAEAICEYLQISSPSEKAEIFLPPISRNGDSDTVPPETLGEDGR